VPGPLTRPCRCFFTVFRFFCCGSLSTDRDLLFCTGLLKTGSKALFLALLFFRFDLCAALLFCIYDPSFRKRPVDEGILIFGIACSCLPLSYARKLFRRIRTFFAFQSAFYPHASPLHNLRLSPPLTNKKYFLPSPSSLLPKPKTGFFFSSEPLSTLLCWVVGTGSTGAVVSPSFQRPHTILTCPPIFSSTITELRLTCQLRWEVVTGPLPTHAGSMDWNFLQVQ